MGVCVPVVTNLRRCYVPGVISGTGQMSSYLATVYSSELGRDRRTIVRSKGGKSGLEAEAQRQ